MQRRVQLDRLNGGGRGIRTPGGVSPTAVFKTAGFNRSPIPPEASVTWGEFPEVDTRAAGGSETRS